MAVFLGSYFFWISSTARWPSLVATTPCSNAITATFAGIASGFTSSSAAGAAAWVGAGALVVCARREEAARPVASAVAKTKVRFMRCLRLLTRIRIPEISAGLLPAQSAAGKAAAPSSARWNTRGCCQLTLSHHRKRKNEGEDHGREGR